MSRLDPVLVWDPVCVRCEGRLSKEKGGVIGGSYTCIGGSVVTKDAEVFGLPLFGFWKSCFVLGLFTDLRP